MDLKYKGYVGSIKRSDGVFHGKILDINDLVTYEAITTDILKQNFISAVNDYIETCKQLKK